MLRFLLDTNIAIYAIKQRHPRVAAEFSENVGLMGISSISVAELLYGAEKSQNQSRAMAVAEDFCSRLRVLDYDHQAAAHYGNIRAALERTGQVISINDMHIAAHARSQGLTLVSNNLRELGRVPGLLTANWAEAAA